MVGAPRIFTGSLNEKADSPPPGGESANLVNWGLVHGEPTRSAHSKDFSKTEKRTKIHHSDEYDREQFIELNQERQ
mgnify:CR=1 FL=1